MARVWVRGGSIGRAVGAAGVLQALAAAVPAIDVAEAGGDGAAWAAPVIASAEGAVSVRAREPVAAARDLLAGETDADLASYLQAQERRLLARAGRIDATDLAEAQAEGAYEGLAAARALAPEALVTLVEASGLRGRGGAYFPVHLKWRAAIEARERNGTPLVVVNAEEGEPGVFKDRLLMEADPHRLVEGIAIACHALGAR